MGLGIGDWALGIGIRIVIWIGDATDIIDINFYDDLICIFQVNVLEKVLILSITCPQFSDLRQFKRYQNGQWANIDIQNKDSLLPVTKKNTIIDFKTKLHAECFYYSTGGSVLLMDFGPPP